MSKRKPITDAQKRTLQTLLDKAYKAIAANNKAMESIREFERGVWGTTHNEINADLIIDSLEYTGTPITVDQFVAEMDSDIHNNPRHHN